MSRRLFLFAACVMAPALAVAVDQPSVPVAAGALPIAAGPFAPTWESLRGYRMPDWFRDAKFGIWAHWGPQCEPAAGDWYARGMYQEGSGQYKSHLARYGHPSQAGFKDIIHAWKADKWDPERLVALYKRAGAKYFFALANHHDNFDLYDSTYQPWNSVKIGPQQDLIGGWAKAAKAQGLRFGVSVHAAHAWTWYEPAQGADKNGDKAGVPYDGKLTKADGKGQWWDGLDPQDLYAQGHPRSVQPENGRKIHSQWDWGDGASLPDAAYCTRFYNRTVDLIDKYQPDLIYFDDTILPLWPVSDAGMRLAAHFYNRGTARNHGSTDVVLFGKVLGEDQRQAVTWDIERGVPATSLPFAWQTDTCIGSWHYDQGVYTRNTYKSAAMVVRMLADIVSKNGNLLLNVPLRGDGTPDEKELKVVADITAWMDVNQEAIFGTRPWSLFGEGPASDGAKLSAQGFNEGKGKPFTAEDVRFTTKDGAIYAIVMDVPKAATRIRALGTAAGRLTAKITEVSLLGSTAPVAWQQNAEALVIEPAATWPCSSAVIYRITLGK